MTHASVLFTSKLASQLITQTSMMVDNFIVVVYLLYALLIVQMSCTIFLLLILIMVSFEGRRHHCTILECCNNFLHANRLPSQRKHSQIAQSSSSSSGLSTCRISSIRNRIIQVCQSDLYRFDFHGAKVFTCILYIQFQYSFTESQ